MGLSRPRAPWGHALDSKTRALYLQVTAGIPGRQAWRGAPRSEGDRRLACSQCHSPVPGGLVTWGRAGVSPGRQVAWDGQLPWTLVLGVTWNLQPRGHSQRCPSPVARSPETRLEVGAVGPGEEGQARGGGGGGGPGEEGRQWGCIPAWAVVWRGPTPWSVSSPALHGPACQHPLASPIRPASPEARRAREPEGPTIHACPPWALSRALSGPCPEAHTGALPKGRPSCCLSLPGGESFLSL